MISRVVSTVRVTGTVLVLVLVTAMTAGAIDGLYGSGGIGTGSGRLAVGLNLSYKFQGYVVSARGVMTESNDKSMSWFTDHTEEFALMMGFSTRYSDDKVSATIEGGISTIRISRVKYSMRHTLFGDVLSADDKSTGSEVGLAVQSQVYFWRVGVTVFGNLNREENVFGALACFRFGRAN